MSHDVAVRFILRAVQDWGQSEADRIRATQAVIDASGFKATATCGPVFGAIWPKPCEGPDATAVNDWLTALTNTMPRGKFEREVEHIEKGIAAMRGAP